jgi:hypothetical protein
LGGDVVGQVRIGMTKGGGARQIAGAVRPGAHQRGKAMASQIDLFIQRGQFALGCGQPRTRAFHRAAVLQPLIAALAGQRQSLAADVDGAGGGIALGMQGSEVGISRSDPRRHRQARGGCLGPGSGGVLLGGVQPGAVLAPEVQLPVQIDPALRVIGPTLGREAFGEEVTIALLGHPALRVERELRQQIGARLLDHRIGGILPRHGNAQIGGALQALGDQRIELLVAIGLPPAVRGPFALSGGREGLGSGKALRRGERLKMAGGRRQGAGAGQQGQRQSAPDLPDPGTTPKRCITHDALLMTEWHNRTVRFSYRSVLASSMQNCTGEFRKGSRMRTKSDERRQAILDVATQIFKDIGYERASMAAIAARVGGSKATLYSYFPRKRNSMPPP